MMMATIRLAMLGPPLFCPSRDRSLDGGASNTSASSGWSKTGTGILHGTGMVGGLETSDSAVARGPMGRKINRRSLRPAMDEEHALRFSAKL